MKQVIVLCEGFTEKTFVQTILKPAFPDLALHGVFPGKMAHKRGIDGDIRYSRVRPDILAYLKDRSGYFCATFFDYYALGTDFPKKSEASHFRLASDKSALMLFSDPSRMAAGLYMPNLTPALAKIRKSFPTPEEIDDGRSTAPSKRLENLIPGYDKEAGGNLAALSVGLEAMEKECPHFRRWLEWLRAI
ncbi:MAG: DUF4276 family protein [Candidatus Sumerlaeota bacterium]|nr:DUF4276 family protein [Candidatus Sumerlaeota bacterium]